MSNITFGGLATGMDSSSIINALMAIEKQPIDRLNAQKTAAAATLSSVQKFSDSLSSLLTTVQTLSSATTLRSQMVTASSSDFLAASAGSSAVAGDYEVKVGRLAQVEKTVYTGVADRDTTTFGVGTLVLNYSKDGTPATANINITNTNDNLQGIRDAINAGSQDHGVTASIVNDGSGTPYRLVLTGKSVTTANITLDASGLTGGTGTFPTKDAAVSRSAQTALIQVDGITITSNTNTLTEAIPGVTLDISHADPVFNPSAPNWSAVTATNLQVDTDTSAVQGKIKDFVTAFNAVVNAAKDDNLAGDGSVRAIVSSLRNKLINTSAGTGLFQLGITTQKGDGTLTVDSTKLAAAIKDNPSSVETLLAGTDTTDGIADHLSSYLTNYTNAISGFMATRQKSYDSSMRSIDDEIVRVQARVDSKEQQLTSQFAALETLVSSLNSQGNYLTQQMKSTSGGN